MQFLSILRIDCFCFSLAKGLLFQVFLESMKLNPCIDILKLQQMILF